MLGRFGDEFDNQWMKEMYLLAAANSPSGTSSRSVEEGEAWAGSGARNSVFHDSMTELTAHNEAHQRQLGTDNTIQALK